MKSQEKATVIRIVLKAFDHKLLDLAALQIVRAVKRIGADFTGPIPLPTKENIFTVIRGPHVHKIGREQFKYDVHKRFLELRDVKPVTMSALEKIDIPSGVEVKVELKGE